MRRLSFSLAAALLLSPLTTAAEPVTDAPTYVVTVVIEDDGEVFARPRMILREGGDASVVVQGRYRIDSRINRATVNDRDQLTLDVQVYQPNAAEWTLVSSPRLIFLPTGTATIDATVGDWDRFQMTVVAAE